MKKPRGILLVEALLSILILGVAITASVRSFAYAGKTHRLTKNYLQALRLMEEKMAELEAWPDLEEGESSDTFKDPHSSFSWSLNIEALHPSSEEDKKDDKEKEPSVKYLKVHLRVKWRTEERSVSADTILVKKEEEEKEEDEEGSEETQVQGSNTR